VYGKILVGTTGTTDAEVLEARKGMTLEVLNKDASDNL